MIKRETPIAADAAAHHRALRRCHGCGAYARPAAEPVDGRLVCEKCFEKARRASDGPGQLVIAEA
jgi:formylmethanofuran dehydrogenase subunit E